MENFYPSQQQTKPKLMRWLPADPLQSFWKLHLLLKEIKMQNAIATSAVVNATSSAAVVKHDTSAVTAAKHSIKVGTNAKVKLEKKPTVATPIQRLETMESATRN